jgi:hypothetical protein
MSPLPRRKYAHTSEHYAKQYGCGVRTIKRYRAKEHGGMVGYPLDDPGAMAELFAAQRNRPQGIQGMAGVAALDSDEYEDPCEVDFGDSGEKPAKADVGGITPTEKLNAAKLEKVLLECARLQFRNEVERAQYTRNDELLPKLRALLAETKAELRKALESELPPKCEGLPAAEIQLKMRDALDDVLGKLTRGTEKLADIEPHELDDDSNSLTSDAPGND